MFSDRHRPDETQRTARQVLKRAFALLDGSEQQPCLSLPRLEALATHVVARPDETLHLRYCRACRVSMAAMQSELTVAAAESSVPDDMRSGVTEGKSMGMSEGDIAHEQLICTTLDGIRAAIKSRPEWSLDCSWAVIDELKKCIDGAQLDRGAQNRLAVRYADTVQVAPDPMKAVLVYSLVFIQQSRRLAIQIAREIAAREAPLAHRILWCVVRTEAPALRMAVGVTGSGQPNQDIDVTNAIDKFMTLIKPPHTIDEAIDELTSTTEVLSNALFVSKDPEETVTKLLTLRRYLGTIAAYAYDTFSADLIRTFRRIARSMNDCATKANAARLAMQVCAILEKPDPRKTLMRKMLKSKPVAPSDPTKNEHVGQVI